MELALDLVTGDTGSETPEDAIPAYFLAEFECINFIANRQAGEPPLEGQYLALMEACLDVAKYSSAASSNMVSLALGEGDEKEQRSEGLRNLAGARRRWPRCFPGMQLPMALEPPR